MQPASELDEGIVHASHAGLVAPQAVRGIRERAECFAAWIVEQRGRRGPRPDDGIAMQLYLAIELVNAIRRKRKQVSHQPTIREALDAWQFLWREVVSTNTMKRRLQRFWPRLALFKRSLASL